MSLVLNLLNLSARGVLISKYLCHCAQGLLEYISNHVWSSGIQCALG